METGKRILACSGGRSTAVGPAGGKGDPGDRGDAGTPGQPGQPGGKGDRGTIVYTNTWDESSSASAVLTCFADAQVTRETLARKAHLVHSRADDSWK